MEHLFQNIQAALNPNGATAVKVDYDLSYGYPKRALMVYGDVSYKNNTIVDSMHSFVPRSGPPETEYVNAKKLWESQRFHNYKFNIYWYGENENKVVYPLKVSVRDQVVVETRDGNNNVVLWYTPPTIDAIMVQIGRHLDANAPYVDVRYSKRGDPEGDFFILSNTEGFLYYRLDSWGYLS